MSPSSCPRHHCWFAPYTLPLPPQPRCHDDDDGNDDDDDDGDDDHENGPNSGNDNLGYD